MGKRPVGARAAWIVIATAVLLVAFILAAFFLSMRGNPRDSITLPDADAAQQSETPDTREQELLMSVDSGNVQKILDTLTRPEAYHQALELTSGWSGGSGKSMVDIWKSGTLLRARISEPAQTRNYLTDGKIVYLWYDAEKTARRLEPDSTVSMDDLIGIPTYENVRTLTASEISEAGFVTLDDLDDANCLFICTVADKDGYQDRYWIDVNTQLLCKADTLLHDGQIYRMQQTSLELLTAEDVGLQKMFRLPDGTAPFSTEG